MKIEEIDPNLKVETALGREDVVFCSVKKPPFAIYGLCDPIADGPFHRLPEDVAAATSPSVRDLNWHTAGGRVRFSTDSPFIAIRCQMRCVGRMPHMPLSGSSGFDLYLHTPDGRDTYIRTFMPPADMQTGYESLQGVNYDGQMHDYTIHFPLYNDVRSLEIGVQAGASLDSGAPYEPGDPIVYYGSSITQGGCASRPGNAYENIISAHTNIDHVNLGFSGSARGEEPMVKYIASLSMRAFVLDYDHNAPSVEHLRKTHAKIYRAVRESHPDIPILLLSKPDGKVDETTAARRDVIIDTYREARAAGDKNVFFIDGYTFFDPEFHDICTVDGTHPTDAGFVGMARVVGRELTRALRKTFW